MRTVVWKNKAELEKMTLDDLYNNLKVYESEVKGSSISSSGAQNLAFMSSNNKSSSSSYETAAYGVSTASTNVSAVGSKNSANISDAAICAFLVGLTTNTQVINQDMEHIDPHNLEEIDLKWQMAMLTIRARRFLKKTRREIKYNGQNNMGFDKSKIEC